MVSLAHWGTYTRHGSVKKIFFSSYARQDSQNRYILYDKIQKFQKNIIELFQQEYAEVRTSLRYFDCIWGFPTNQQMNQWDYVEPTVNLNDDVII